MSDTGIIVTWSVLFGCIAIISIATSIVSSSIIYSQRSNTDLDSIVYFSNTIAQIATVPYFTFRFGSAWDRQAKKESDNLKTMTEQTTQIDVLDAKLNIMNEVLSRIDHNTHDRAREEDIDQVDESMDNFSMGSSSRSLSRVSNDSERCYCCASGD